MDKETAGLLKLYAERFLGAMERIAKALEDQNVHLSAPFLPEPPAAGETRVSPAVLPVSSVPVRMETQSTPVAGAPIDYPTFKAAVMAYQEREGYEAAMNVIKAAGATYLKDVPPEKYADILAKLQ